MEAMDACETPLSKPTGIVEWITLWSSDYCLPLTSKVGLILSLEGEQAFYH